MRMKIVKVLYKGRNPNEVIESPVMKNKYTAKDGVIAKMTLNDFQAILASGDNNKLFVLDDPGAIVNFKLEEPKVEEPKVEDPPIDNVTPPTDAEETTNT